MGERLGRKEVEKGGDLRRRVEAKEKSKTRKENQRGQRVRVDL